MRVKLLSVTTVRPGTGAAPPDRQVLPGRVSRALLPSTASGCTVVLRAGRAVARPAAASVPGGLRSSASPPGRSRSSQYRAARRRQSASRDALGGRQLERADKPLGRRGPLSLQAERCSTKIASSNARSLMPESSKSTIRTRSPSHRKLARLRIALPEDAAAAGVPAPGGRRLQHAGSAPQDSQSSPAARAFLITGSSSRSSVRAASCADCAARAAACVCRVSSPGSGVTRPTGTDCHSWPTARTSADSWSCVSGRAAERLAGQQRHLDDGRARGQVGRQRLGRETRSVLRQQRQRSPLPGGLAAVSADEALNDNAAIGVDADVVSQHPDLNQAPAGCAWPPGQGWSTSTGWL